MKWVGIAVAVLIGLGVLMALVGSLLPRDHVASRSIRLKQPAVAVWQIITAYGDASWRSGIKRAERLPDLEGREVWSEIDSHGQAMPLETLEQDPPRRLVRRIADASLPFGGTWTYEIGEADGGSRITITERGEVKNAIFRFVGRFIIGHAATIDTYLKDLGKNFGETVTPS